MTFNQLAVIIAEPLGKALDDPFKEMLKDRIKYWRSRLLRNSLEKKPADRKFFTQSVTLTMEEVSATECGIDLDCRLFRSVQEIPTPARANSILFDFVGSIEGTNPFKLVKRHELPYLLGDRYSPLVSDYYLYENGHILTLKAPYIRMEYIADDPEKLAALSCNGTVADCNNEDVEVHVNGELAQLIVQSILQVDFGRTKEEEDETEVKVNEQKLH